MNKSENLKVYYFSRYTCINHKYNYEHLLDMNMIMRFESNIIFLQVILIRLSFNSLSSCSHLF